MPKFSNKITRGEVHGLIVGRFAWTKFILRGLKYFVQKWSFNLFVLRLKSLDYELIETTDCFSKFWIEMIFNAILRPESDKSVPSFDFAGH